MSGAVVVTLRVTARLSSQPGNWCGGVAWGTEGCIQAPCGYPGAAPCSGPGNTPDGTPPTGPPRKAILSNSDCKQTSWAVSLAAYGMSKLSSLTGYGFSFGYSAAGTYALGAGGQVSGGQAIVTTTSGKPGILTFGSAGVTGGFGASASMNFDFGASTYGTLDGYAGSSSGGSLSFYDGLGGGGSVTGNQSGVQGVVSFGVGAGGAIRAGGSYGASYGKAVPIC
jgi:hypothetical protein